MRKEDNDWSIDNDIDNDSEIGFTANINEQEYSVSPNFAALTHAILLLVDAINDNKKVL